MQFSIVIPVYNAKEHVLKAIESCTQQSYMPLEIIVVDDASYDETVMLIERWKNDYKGGIEIQLLRLTENSGPSVARNRGWQVARGDYVAFLDADDQFIVDKLEKIEITLRDNNDIVLLGHDAYVGDVVEKDSSISLKKLRVRDFLKRNPFTTPSVIVKRETPERFDEKMRYTEDHDLWLRITQKYQQSYYLDEKLTVIDRPVRSKGGQSANLWAMRKGELLMYNKFCHQHKLLYLLPIFYLFSLSKHLYKYLGDGR